MATKINFEIGFKTNTSGLKKIQNEFKAIQNMTFKDFLKFNPQGTIEDLKRIKNSTADLEVAFKRAFNTDLGTVNMKQFSAELRKLDIKTISRDMASLGASGRAAFTELNQSIITANGGLRESHTLLDKMQQSLARTVSWQLSTGVINTLTGTLRKSYNFVKDLDTSLNNIRIVTGKSADEMARFGQEANNIAKQLSTKTTTVTDAALIYYQQGLSDEEAKKRAEITTKVANVTGQSASAVSSELTAVWNGYKVSAEEAEQYVDKLSAVAATTASDLSELATGMSKVASAANTMGVDVDQLNAMLSTVVSVTREAPESVGTAFKTIFARMGDIQSGLDTTTTLDNYTKKIKEISGISVLDTTGKMRDLGEVIEEVGDKWGDMSNEQQQALAQAMGGTRQYTRLIALFDNWDNQYKKALKTSRTADGQLEEQNEIHQDKIEAHLKTLGATGEEIFTKVLDSDAIKDVIDALTNITESFGKMLDAVGGFGNIFPVIMAKVGKSMTQTLGKGARTSFNNLTRNIEETEQIATSRRTNREQLKSGNFTKEQEEVAKFNDLINNRGFSRRKGLTDEEKEAYYQVSNSALQNANDIDQAREDENIIQAFKDSRRPSDSSVANKNNNDNNDNNQDNNNQDKDNNNNNNQDKDNNNNNNNQDKDNNNNNQDKENTQNITSSDTSYLDSLYISEDGEKSQELEKIEAELDEKQAEIQKVRDKLKQLDEVNADVNKSEKKQEDSDNEKIKETQSDDSKEKYKKETEQDIDNNEDIQPNDNEKYDVKDDEENQSNDELQYRKEQENNQKFDNNITEQGQIENVDSVEQKPITPEIEFPAQEQQEIESDVNEVSEQATESATNAQEELIESVENYNEELKKELETLKELVEIYGSLGESEQKVYAESSEGAKHQIDNAEAAKKTYKDLKKAQEQGAQPKDSKALQEQVQKVKKANKDIATTTTAVNNQRQKDVDKTRKAVERATKQETKDMQKVQKNTEKAMKRIKAGLVLEDSISSVGQLTSGVATTTQGLQMMGSAIQAAKEGNLAWYESLGSISMALATTISGIGDTVSGIKILAPLLRDGGKAAISAAKSLFVKAEADTTEAATADVATTSNLAMWMAILGPGAVVMLGVVAMIAAIGASAKKSGDEGKDAAEKAAEASKKATTEAENTKEAYDNLKTSVEAYKDQVNSLNKLSSSTDEFKESLEEANKKAQELMETNKELAKYATRDSRGLIIFQDENGNEIDLDEAVQKAQYTANRAEGVAAQTKIKEEDIKLKHSKDVLGKAVDNLSDEEINKIVQIARQKDGNLIKSDLQGIVSENTLKELVTSSGNLITPLQNLANTVKKHDDTVKEQIRIATKKDLENDEEYNELDATQQNVMVDFLSQDIDQDKLEALQEEEQQKYHSQISRTQSYTEKGWLWDTDKKLDLVGVAEWVEDRKKALSKDQQDDADAYYADMLSQFEQDSGFTNAHITKWGNVAYTNAEGKTDYILAEDFEEKAAEYAAQNRISDLNEERKEILYGLMPELTAQLQGLGDRGLTDEMWGFFTGADKIFNASSMSMATYNELQKQLVDRDGQGIKDILSQYSDSELEALGVKGGSAGIDEFINSMQESFNNPELEEKVRERAKEGLKNLSKDFVTLSADIVSGELTAANADKNEEYQLLAEKVKELAALYPEASAEAEIFLNKNLIGTQEWTEAFGRLEDKINQFDLDALTEEFDKAWDDIADKDTGKIDINLALQSEDFQEKLDTLLKADYAINVKVHTQAEQAFDKTKAAMDKISEQASKIGDGFIASAEDIRTLNQTFPGILKNVQNLRDGTVRLNQEAVQSAIKAAKTETIENLKESNSKLEIAAQELRSKQKNYQAIADAAKALAKGNIESAEVEAKYKATIEQGLQDMAKESHEVNLKDQASVTNNSATNSQKTAENWAHAYEEASLNAAEFAKTAISAHEAAQTGKGKVYSGTFGVNYTAQTGVSAEAEQVEELNKLYETGTNDAYGKIASAYQQAADAAGAEANDIEGMIVENTIRMEGLMAELNGVAAGAGADGVRELLELLEEEYDIYHDINIEIGKIEKNLDRLQKTQAKLTGQELVDNLNEQLGVLKQQEESYQKKLNLMKLEQAALHTYLESQGVNFNSDGSISNYLNYLNAYQNKINSMRSQLHELDSDSNSAKQLEQEITLTEKNFEKVKDKISRYDELVFTEMEEMQDKAQELVDKEIEINVAKFKMQIQVTLDFSQAEREFIEFKKNVLFEKDDFVNIARSDLKTVQTYYNGTSDNNIEKLTKQLTDTQNELNLIKAGGASEIFGTNAQLAEDTMKEYRTQLMTQVKEMQTAVQRVEADYLNAIKNAIKEFDKHANQYATIGKYLNHDLKLVQLLYGKDNYAAMSKYYEQIEENNLKQLDFYRKRADEAEKRMQSATTKEAKEAWEQEWQKALEKLNSTTESSIQNLINKHKNAISEIMNDLDKTLTDGLGSDYVKQEWELIQKDSKWFLDTIDTEYSFKTLEDKLNKSIDDAGANSLAIQQKLLAFRDKEIKSLRDKENLTKADFDIANKKYDLLLKQIALEDAQRNKSQMRLRRDSQGNYSYQFVEDQDKVSQAQADLDKANQDLYDTVRDRTNTITNEIRNSWTKLQQDIIKVESDTTLSEEERQNKIQILTNDTANYIQKLSEDLSYNRIELMDVTFDAYANVMGKTKDEFINMSQEEQQEMMTNLVPTWDTSVQDMINKIAGQGGFVEVCQEAYVRLEEETANYEDSLDRMANTAGLDFNELDSGIDSAITKTQDLMSTNDDLMNKYQQEMNTIQSVVDTVKNLSSAYETARENAIKALTVAQKYLELQQQLAMYGAKATSGNNGDGDTGAKIPGGNSSSSAGNTSSSAGNTSSTGAGDNDENTDDTLFSKDRHNWTGVVQFNNVRGKTEMKRFNGSQVLITSGDNINGYSIKTADGKTFTNISQEEISAVAGQANFTLVKDTKKYSFATEEASHAFGNILYKKAKNNQGSYNWSFYDADSKRLIQQGTSSYDTPQHAFQDINNGGKLRYASEFKKYDTGGYTGAWGNEGRLAVLHQKELVLNKEDTSNVLTAVNTVRNMEGLLSSLGNAVSNRTNGLLGLLSNSFGMTSVAKEQFEQNVHIDANFPNVTDRFEIENAFENLVNLASMEALKS